MARGILLDTSIWICYPRPHGWDDLKMAVQQVLTLEQVYTCWVVMAELLIGARDERGFTQLFETLRALPEILVTDRVWEAIARLGYTLRRWGGTIPLPDLVMAQAAITGDLSCGMWMTTSNTCAATALSRPRALCQMRAGERHLKRLLTKYESMEKLGSMPHQVVPRLPCRGTSA